MMSDENDSDFHIDFKKDSSGENLVTFQRSRSTFIGYITRFINQINEKLSWNFKTIKCLEEQLYQC